MPKNAAHKKVSTKKTTTGGKPVKKSSKKGSKKVVKKVVKKQSTKQPTKKSPTTLTEIKNEAKRLKVPLKMNGAVRTRSQLMASISYRKK